MTVELEALKWGAGSRIPLNPFDSIDSDEVLRLVAAHRVTGRMLRRLQRVPKPWSDDNLIGELARMQEADEEKVKHQIKTFKQLSDSYSSPDHVLISLKGFTSYLLLDDHATMRPSGDIDIVCSNKERFFEVLDEQGYSRYDADAVSLHLFSPKSYRGDVVIDAYDFVPVWEYTHDTEQTQRIIRCDALVHHQTSGPKFNQIGFHDLIENSIQYVSKETGILIVPNHTMMTFLLCTHAFRDFFQSLPNPAYPMPKLGTLADIYDLAKHPKFMPEVFVTLVRRFGGEDCVLFAGNLLQAYFGENPIPSISAQYEHSKLWQLYYFYTFGLPAPFSLNDLLICPDPTKPLSKLVDVLGGSTVNSKALANGTTLSVFRQEAQSIRALVKGDYDGRTPIDLSLCKRSEGLSLALTVHKKHGYWPNIVLLDFGAFKCYWLHNNLTGDWRYLGKSVQSEYNYEEDRYRLFVLIPSSDLKHLVSEQGYISLLLTVFSLDSDQAGRPIWSKTKSSSLIPLKIVWKY